MNKELSIIIPAYNESKRIVSTLKKLTQFFDAKSIYYEIIVVDDGSSDDTKKVVESLRIKNLRLLVHDKNYGKGKAVNTGVREADGKYILFADADNSTPIVEFDRLEVYNNEYPVVIGSRYLKESKVKVKQPLSRILAARAGNLLIQALILPGIPDTQCGFKLFEHSAAKKIFAKQTIWRWGFDMEILVIAKKMGYKIKQVPVDWYNDESSRIQSSSVFLKTLTELFRIKWNSVCGRYKG